QRLDREVVLGVARVLDRERELLTGLALEHRRIEVVRAPVVVGLDLRRGRARDVLRTVVVGLVGPDRDRAPAALLGAAASSAAPSAAARGRDQPEREHQREQPEHTSPHEHTSVVGGLPGYYGGAAGSAWSVPEVIRQAAHILG